MKRNTLTTAVLAGLTGMAGMMSVANAVNVNPDGTGQVLIYPFYTARGGNDTLISIVNTTERGKAVKVRFIEALNSREVLDFNLYMSPYDVWTAVITESDAGGGLMRTFDNSCTVPYFWDAETGFGEQPFLDFEFTGKAKDLTPASGIERTASGYIEVIEMGTMVERAATGEGRIEFWSKHQDSTGRPLNCQALVNAWREYEGAPPAGVTGAGLWTSGAFDINYGFTAPTGGLFGGANIINVTDGTMFSYNATALDGFWEPGRVVHRDPSDLEPNLRSGGNTESLVFDNGVLRTHDWTASLLAVNATITHDKLFNEYVTDSAIDAQTEWVLTFPTKKFHTDTKYTATPIQPFTRLWPNACEDIAFRFWDREEREPVPGSSEPIVSPRPPAPTPGLFQLCQEANVIRFGGSDDMPSNTEILAEPSRPGVLGYANLDLPYNAGWLKMDLANIPAGSTLAITERRSLPATNGDRVLGLPVVGFGVSTFLNSNVEDGVRANYGGTFNHRGTRAFVAS